MPPKGALCVWIRMYICYLLATLSQASTVSFFENCGATVQVRNGDKYTLKINGSQFKSGDTSCRLVLKGILETGSGLVDCHTVGMSKLGHGAQMTVVTLGPETKKTYNYSKKIDERFESAKQYILEVTKTEFIFPVLINVTLEVSQLDYDDLVGMQKIFTYTAVTIFMACCLLALGRICTRYGALGKLDDCLCQSLPRDLCADERHRGELQDSAEATVIDSGLASFDSCFRSTPTHLSLDVSRLSSDHEQSYLNSRDDPPSYESCLTSPPPDVIAHAQPSNENGISDDPQRSYHHVLYNISSITSSDLSGDTDDGLPTYSDYIDSQADNNDANLTSTPRQEEDSPH